MAIKYWYITGSSANWNTANWYPQSGGGAGATTLLAVDDAILDANSGTGSLNISAAATCNSFDATYYSGSLTGTAALTIIQNTFFPGTGSFCFGAAMTQSYTGITTFSGSYPQSDIYCNEQSFKGNVIFDTSKPDGQFRKPSDNSKIKNYLPDFKFTPLYKGLKETIDWFEGNYNVIRK